MPSLRMGAAAGFGGRAGAVSAQSVAFQPAVQTGSVLGYKINKAQNKSNCACCLRQAGLRFLAECVKAKKRENKSDSACRSCKAGLRLLSGVYDGYGISPYEGQGRAFSCEKIYKSGFPKRRGRGVRPSLRGGYCGSEAGGRIRPPPPKQSHAL